MEYTRLGNTGLNVSRICFGCMWFGRPGNGGIDVRFGEDQAREVIRYAWERGINFFDTANYYSLGASEEVLGKVIAQMGVRDDAVIATKSYYPMYEGTNAKGVNRKTLFREVDASLRRLGTDYIDLYVPHRLDHDTPMEEQMEALNDLVRSGKVLYIGASAMYAWQFLKMNMIAEAHGWAKFVSMQDMYNLVYREEEKEMHPMLLDQERVLRYPTSFGAYEALALGQAAIDLAPEYESGYTITITRECNGVRMFQWVADDKEERNLLFAEGKLCSSRSRDHSFSVECVLSTDTVTRATPQRF